MPGLSTAQRSSPAMPTTRQLAFRLRASAEKARRLGEAQLPLAPDDERMLKAVAIAMAAQLDFFRQVVEMAPGDRPLGFGLVRCSDCSASASLPAALIAAGAPWRCPEHADRVDRESPEIQLGAVIGKIRILDADVVAADWSSDESLAGAALGILGARTRAWLGAERLLVAMFGQAGLDALAAARSSAGVSWPAAASPEPELPNGAATAPAVESQPAPAAEKPRVEDQPTTPPAKPPVKPKPPTTGGWV